jgi:hypothetical protein
LQASGISVVLVGGQAVNFWAVHYSTETLDWKQHMPYSSQDIDVLGSKREADEIAKALNGRITRNDNLEDSVTSAVVAIERNGKTILIDVLGNVFGLDAQEVQNTAIELESIGGSAISRVMHPFIALKGKLACLKGLPQGGRQDEKHVHLCILAIKEYIKDLVHSGIDDRSLLNIIKEVFDLARQKPALYAWYKHEIAVETCLPWEALDTITTERFKKFQQINKNQRFAQLQTEREEHATSEERVAAIREALNLKRQKANDSAPEKEDPHIG